jgi:Phosphotransferase enzyme family
VVRLERRPSIYSTSFAIEKLFGNYDRVVERLLEFPVTFLHGEFYASNVLVVCEEGEGWRVCPVDWEMAAVGPGLIDLAALTAGRWTADEREEFGPGLPRRAAIYVPQRAHAGTESSVRSAGESDTRRRGDRALLVHERGTPEPGSGVVDTSFASPVEPRRLCQTVQEVTRPAPQPDVPCSIIGMRGSHISQRGVRSPVENRHSVWEVEHEPRRLTSLARCLRGGLA